MFRRSSLAALFVGVALLAGGSARAASDYDFGMALMNKFGFEEEAEKFFSDLQKATAKEVRLTGTFGMGGIKKLRADRAEDAAKATELYAEAKGLIKGFLKDASSNHPDRGAATAVLLDIEKLYLNRLTIVIRDMAAPEDEREKALAEAKDIVKRLIGPLREEKKRRLKDLPAPGKPISGRVLEAAVNAMVRYYGMGVRQIELFPKGDKEGKKIAADIIAEMEGDSGLFAERELAGVVLKVDYELGRANVAAGNLQQASTHFDSVIDTGTDRLPAAAREFVKLHQRYAYFMKAKAYFDAEKWDTAIEIVDSMFGDLPNALNEDQGNAALLLKAEALFRKTPPDYAGAIREATRVVERGLRFWPNNANQLMAKILGAMEKDADSVALSPGALHGVAVGMVQLFYRERDPAARQAHLEKAIFWLQKTIAATRAEGVKLKMRLKHGPTAWFELGIIYSKMQLWYEARFSFEAVLRYYAKDVVGRSLAALPKYGERLDQIKKDIKAGKIKPAEDGGDVNEFAALFDEAAKDADLKALLAGLKTRLDKSANNFMVAARRRHNESKSEFDAERLDEAIKIQISVNPDTKDRLDFNLGLLDRKAAEGLMKAKQYAKAVAKYESACAYFLSSAKGLASTREVSYHLAGMAYYKVMSELGKAEVEKKFPELAKRAPEFGESALKAFASFMAETAKHPDALPDEKKKRDGRIAKVDVARPVIYMALGKFAEAVAATDEFLARDVKDEAFVPTVMWTRVRALREIAIKAVGTRSEASALAKVEEAADAIKVDAKQYEKGALSLKAAVYNAAATKLRELAEKAEGRNKSSLLARADDYSRRNAEITKEMIEMGGGTVTLPFLLSLATQFYQQKAYVGAREIYADRILKEYDPNGTGQKMVIAEDMFESAAKSARIGDFKKSERALKKARERIKALKELVFGEPIEERRDKQYSGLIHPPKKMNWAKAYNEISEVLREAPDLASGPQLKKVADELVFRIQMLQVKLNLADCNMALARKLVESKPEEAGELFEQTVELIKNVREYYWRDNELRYLQAEANMNLGKLQEARDLYTEASRRSPEGSPNYYRGRIAYSKTTYELAETVTDKKAAIKLIRKAMGFPDLLVKTSESEDAWKKVWPEAADFVAMCEAAIQARDGNVVLAGYEGEIEDDPRYDIDISPEDQNLITQITIVQNRIEAGNAEEKDRQALVKETIEVYLTQLPDRLLKTVQGKVMQGRKGGGLTKEEAEFTRRRYFVRFLHQSPFSYYKLRKLAVTVGALETEKDAMPVGLLSEKALKVAKRLGYVTKDGEIVPLEELPEEDQELLRKDLDAVEEDAPEDGAAPAPEEDAAGDEAAAPAEEVAP